jgi:hypothetical protein
MFHRIFSSVRRFLTIIPGKLSGQFVALPDYVQNTFICLIDLVSVQPGVSLYHTDLQDQSRSEAKVPGNAKPDAGSGECQQ